MVADHQGRELQGGIGRFVADMLGRDARVIAVVCADDLNLIEFQGAVTCLSIEVAGYSRGQSGERKDAGAD